MNNILFLILYIFLLFNVTKLQTLKTNKRDTVKYIPHKIAMIILLFKITHDVKNVMCQFIIVIDMLVIDVT